MRRPAHTDSSNPADEPVASLSKRRREVLELLAKGLTNEEIGRALGITEGTVRAHVTAVLAHLDVANRTEAASVWTRFEAHPARVEDVMLRVGATEIS